jgi:hypothetical protein
MNESSSQARPYVEGTDNPPPQRFVLATRSRLWLMEVASATEVVAGLWS